MSVNKVLLRLRGLTSGSNAVLAAAIVSATVIMASSAAIGIRNARPESKFAAPEEILNDSPSAPSESTPGIEAPAGIIAPARADGSATPATGRKVNSVAAVSTPGATREGIFSDRIEVGVHGPLTLNGYPLNLAEDPVTGLKGYITYINRTGGINGRKIKLFLEDDKYNTTGGAESRDKLVREVKPFLISGILGVDQIAIVSSAAGQSKIPYMAVGGPEPEWRTRGMYQLGSSYDQYASILSEYICKQGKGYVGEDVRLGTTTLDTEFILPVEARFVSTLEACGVGKVDSLARGKIQKPDVQTSYAAQALDLKRAYGGKGANLIVPLQDPVSTSRQVAEWKGQGYRPKWTFSSFAHDLDTTLALMGGDWTGTRGLKSTCIIRHPQAFSTSLCANLKAAHDEWVSLGQVSYDEYVSGAKGSNGSSYNYNEDSWQRDGQDGSLGYSLVHFWVGALRSIGADPTREKFIAALNSYDRYSDLVTGPITFKGSANIMRGAAEATVIEGQADLKYKQIAELTPGLTDHF